MTKAPAKLVAKAPPSKGPVSKGPAVKAAASVKGVKGVKASPTRGKPAGLINRG